MMAVFLRKGVSPRINQHPLIELLEWIVYLYFCFTDLRIGSFI